MALSFLNPLAPYKNAILWGLLIAGLAGVGYAGVKLGSFRVQAKWDAETVVVQKREIQLKDHIIVIQNEAAERARQQAEKDSAAAAQGAAERAKLAEQSAQVKRSLDQLTRDLAKNPQYRDCKVDPSTLAELNRSLK